MKNKIAVLALSLLATAFSACAMEPAKIEIQAPPTPPVAVGGDRDAHGCIGSAGYSWCTKENACVRSWELAREKSFEASAENFESYCSGKKK